MAKIDDFDRETNLPGGSFSRLLLSDDEGDITTTSTTSVIHSTSFSPTVFSANTPKMLCFGDQKRKHDEIDLGFIASLTTSATTTTTQKATSVSYRTEPAICASTSSSNTNSISSSIVKSNKKRNGSGQKSEEKVQRAGPVTTNTMGDQRICKKNKGENNSYRSSSTRHAKVKREKLGERIVALQQLVSPFGKTDTASVLHEAMGYIRFLQDQVKVLCSPYLFSDDKALNKADKGGSLRRRGLCLIPVECIMHVANTNGADFWSSNTVNTLSKK